MKRVILNALLIISFYSCNGQRKEQISKEKQEEETDMRKENEQIIDILVKQIEYGKPSFDNPYKYNSKDLEVILPKLKNILSSNGFVIIKRSDFEAKIKTVFGRVIDPNSDSQYLYVNFLDKCNVQPKYFPNDINSYFGNFIIKNGNFITESYAIPQIIDYQREFKETSIKENDLDNHYKDEQGEEVSKYLWKDDKRLNEQRKKNVQTFVARNMYLFNDSRAHFKWLILNDEIFMRSLVTTFSYYDDKELVKWVVDKTEFTNQNIDEVNRIIYNKKCDGKVVFDQQLLTILTEDTTKEVQFYELIKYNNYTDWLLSDKSKTELTFSQKAEIIARIHSFIYSHAKDYRTVDFMGKFAEYNDSDNKYSKEFKLKNYYNIPEFEKQWKQAKIDGDGISLSGEE
jgi:hypothetical protein